MILKHKNKSYTNNVITSSFLFGNELSKFCGN